MSNKLQAPNDVSGQGKDTLITTYTPSVSPYRVEEIFFKLQNKHREYEATLNGLKHKMEMAITESSDAAASKYEKEVTEWSAKLRELLAKTSLFRDRAIQTERDRKIAIPNDLKEVYEEVSKLGK
jgi:Skp family chaperone for outer membrane proteins